MNRKIILSAMSILTSLALVSGAAFAFFSSTATSTGNIFASGTLSLKLDDVTHVTPLTTISASFGATGMAPGATTSGFISMHNDGTINIAEVNLTATETATSTPDLAGKLIITSAKIDTNSTCTATPTDIGGSFTTLAALNGADLDLPSSSLGPGATKFLCMTFKFDPTADDTYQGKSITETFTFVGNQDISQ